MKTLTQIRTALDHEVAKLQAVVTALLGIEADIDDLIVPPPPLVLKSGPGCYGTASYGDASY